MSATRSMTLLASETALHEGPTPLALPGALREMPTYAISHDAFLLRLPSGLTFHYAQGRGVAFSRPDSVSDLEVSLFANGSVYGAVSWINGLVPLHASAVVHDGRVHAFTGQSGAGKSTLAAALGKHGLPLFADDVLVLDLSDPEQVMCLPGHKQLKLWRDALEITGLPAGERVRHDLEKFYIAAPAGHHGEPLPLAQLDFLEEASKSTPVVSPVRGSERLTRARAAFYRPHFCAAIADTMDVFTILSRLAQQVPFARFDRPRRKEAFEEGAVAMAVAIRGRRP